MKQFAKHFYIFFSVDTEIEECGLPHWLVSRKTWSNMDSSLTIETIRGSTRGINMVVKYNNSNPTHSIKEYWEARKRTKSKQATSEWKKINDQNLNTNTSPQPNSIKSQVTCHTILASNTTNGKYPQFAKLIAYQKLGW